jgi:hypothetical protein
MNQPLSFGDNLKAKPSLLQEGYGVIKHGTLTSRDDSNITQ